MGKNDYSLFCYYHIYMTHVCIPTYKLDRLLPYSNNTIFASGHLEYQYRST